MAMTAIIVGVFGIAVGITSILSHGIWGTAFLNLMAVLLGSSLVWIGICSERTDTDIPVKIFLKILWRGSSVFEIAMTIFVATVLSSEMWLGFSARSAICFAGLAMMLYLFIVSVRNAKKFWD